MGMYTGLRFKGTIKEEYRKDIKKMLIDGGNWNNCRDEELKKFDDISRSSLIPFGGLDYTPDCWETDDDKDADGFERYFNDETGLLCFQCSLKNYERTIEYFIYNIMPIICDELIHCEKLYEEDEVSTLYKLNDGLIVELDCGIKYGLDNMNDLWCMYKNEPEDGNIMYDDFDFSGENKYR